MSVVMLSRDDFVGRLVTGRVASGMAKVGDQIIALNRAGEKTDSGKVTKIFHRTGEKGVVEIPHAVAGDIVQIAGLSKATVADTICHPTNTRPLDTVPIDPPTVCMTFSPNDSPLAGQEGSKMTSQLIWERLVREAETNVSLQVKRSDAAGEAFEVYGRGELQLGILIENMRREGFELSVSPPQVQRPPATRTPRSHGLSAAPSSESCSSLVMIPPPPTLTNARLTAGGLHRGQWQEA